MNTSAASTDNIKRRGEASRLIAVAIDMLDEESEQIVRDYLNHALGALERVREADRASDGEVRHK